MCVCFSTLVLTPQPCGAPPASRPLHRLLRSYPLIRLGFVVYLLVLHLWVLVVLGWQTHALEEGALADRVNNRRGPR